MITTIKLSSIDWKNKRLSETVQNFQNDTTYGGTFENKEYVMRVLQEKEATTKRIGTPSPRTILQIDH